MRIVLLGAPGSGKGTQAQRLMAERGIPQISTGDLLRSAVEAGSEYGKLAREKMDGGELVPDDIVLGIIRERLDEEDTEDGFVLDGFPRNQAQAEALDSLLEELGRPLDAAILMDVDFEVLMKRLTGRRICSATGKLLNIHYSPREEIEACIAAGGELVQRDDDNEETIKNRLEVYRRETEPLIDYYRERDLLHTVDAEGSIEEVYRRLLETVPA